MDESRASNINDFSVLSGDRAPGSDAFTAVDGNGEPLFVINLCAAMTPISLEGQALAGLDQYKLYQVSRMEDGRRRYRLRLGFFTTVALAEDVLASVRARYATAFTSCLCEEDLKHATGYLKCSVQDLERTGRYSVQKLRGDSGGTTALRVLTPEALQQLQDAEVQAAKPTRPSVTAPSKPATPTATVLPIRVPLNHRPDAQLPPRSAAPSVPPIVERRQPGSPLRAAPSPKPPTDVPQPAAADRTQTLKALIMTPANAPKRESLMRRAQAMAPSDAIERAKAVPGHAASEFVDTLATGKFKIPSVTPAPAPTAAARPLPPAPPAPRVTPAPVAPSKPAPPSPVANKVLEAHTPPQTPTAPIQKRNQPFHVGAGINIPETSLSLAPSDASAIAPPKSGTQVSPVMQAAEGAMTSDLLRARELAKQSAQWRQDNGEIPTLDTTQTIRTLTKSELEDANRPKWFTVQLAISDHPANLDTMPKLDIFDAYSLYSVAVMEGGGIRHALRLGFFREEVSAEAVMGYLRTFFSQPVITRIPDAEHERFIDAPKLSALTKPANINVTLDEKHAAKYAPVTNAVPTVNTAVERTAAMTKQPPRGVVTHQHQPKPMARSAPLATKRAASTTSPSVKKPAAHVAKNAGAKQHDLLDESQLLGLSDTAILRVQKNPSLLSRLVGKLGK